MKIAIAQMNATVGDIDGNVARIAEFARRARERGADVIVTPELAVCGYPPEDLLLRTEFLDACAMGVAALVERVRGITLVVGHPRSEGRVRYNSASVVRDGRVVHVYDKRSLPNLSVFDERRYFAPAAAPCVFGPRGVCFGTDIADERASSQVAGAQLGLNICADAWDSEAPRVARDAGARILLVPNASPYHVNKHETRHRTMRQRAAETGLAIVYVNLVGGQDELVFDGASFVMSAEGEITHELPAFDEALEIVEIIDGVPRSGRIAQRASREAEIYAALELGVRDYVRKNGFSSALVGVSGGIDSALTLAIAADALGASNLRAVMMPSPYTADMTREDARLLCQSLGVRYAEISIAPILEAYRGALGNALEKGCASVTAENLQARIRGALLMALSNDSGALVLATGNKSELATGYATLYGDMAGGFAVLRDVEKTLVYRLAQYRNGLSPVIPQRVIDRAPTAELRSGQLDVDSLPPYSALDAILQAYVEDGRSPDEIVEQGHARADVGRVVELVRRSEYKRRQAPIGVRITPRAFGKDWRYPITNAFGARRREGERGDSGACYPSEAESPEDR